MSFWGRLNTPEAVPYPKSIGKLSIIGVRPSTWPKVTPANRVEMSVPSANPSKVIAGSPRSDVTEA